MDKFTMLQELGAGDFQHLNGSLEAHLKGTEQVLINWGSSELLQIAGLFMLHMEQQVSMKKWCR
ncbi:hypothetical protein JCM19233_5641 [Vibrio astriarenae]|nr:hypothetical protein JCM19233_5641 [Vibrio sp. C7]